MAELNLNMSKNQKREMTGVTGDNSFTHEVSEEFSLPDYVSEIRRVLNVKAQVLPESRFISDMGDNSRLEIGGTVTYLIVYINDDMELCSLPLTSAYEAETTLNSHPTTVFIDTAVDNVSCRVNAPRRLTVKTRLKSRILALEERQMEERIEGKGANDELFMERQEEALTTVSLLPISMQNVKMNDKLECGSNLKKPLWCDANISITDTKAQNNSVSVRGVANIKCVCQGQEGVFTVSKSIPVAEELEAKGACQGDMARVMGRCVSLTVSNEENDQSGQLFFDLTCELEGELIRNTEIVLTKDCYSTKCETEAEYKTIDVYTASKAQNTSFTVSEGVKRKSKEMTEIVDIISDPVYEKTEAKNGKCIISGKLNMTVIGRSGENDEGDREYLSESYEIPFKFNCEVSKTSQDIISRCDLSIGEINARLENDKIMCTAEIFVAYELLEKSQAKILNRATLLKDREIKKEPSCVRVYFPTEKDTLWDVAKKYHVTVSKLRENNDLTTDSLTNVKNIII